MLRIPFLKAKYVDGGQATSQTTVTAINSVTSHSPFGHSYPINIHSVGTQIIMGTYTQITLGHLQNIDVATLQK